MRKTRLFTPGPTPLIPEAQLIGAAPLIHHRTKEFKNLLLETRRNLQAIFRTENPMVILSSSGTGAMEAAVSNLHSSGDKVLAVVAGKFGERWVELAAAYGLDCVPLCKEYGSAATATEIAAKLRENRGVQSLLIQGCETSTGASHDLKGIAGEVRKEFMDLLIIVDGITTVACQRLEPDVWDLDVVICGSQKAFGIPPGLAFMSLSPRALKQLDRQPGGAHYYLDLKKEVAGQTKGMTAYTPAISLIRALNEATRQMLGQGVDALIDDSGKMARACRKGLLAMGFRLLSSSPANALTAAFPPKGVGADDLQVNLEAKWGIKVAGGQGKLKGSIIRIAHLGYFDILDVFSVLAAIELCLADMGRPVPVGAGTQAAMQELRGTTVPAR